MNNTLKNEFEIFDHIQDLHYLDSAATAQKPKAVIRAITDYYRMFNGNAGRGSHDLAIAAERVIEAARSSIAALLHAGSKNEIVFTKNATEALNIIAYCYGAEFLQEGDEIILGISNHHANLVPWQYAAKKTGAVLRYARHDADGNFDVPHYTSLLNSRTKIVAVSAVVNTTGVINPIEEIITHAKKQGAATVIDAAQSIVHTQHDVQKLDCDFLAFSGHKMYAGLGAGVLYGKADMLQKMPPFLYGGEMIEFVEEYSATFQDAPKKYEGGTMNAEAIYSLSAALDFIFRVGYDELHAHTTRLESYALAQLSSMPFIDLYHTAARSRAGTIAFNVHGVHSHDTAHILNEYKVMVRSGHHCTQPLMKSLHVPSCCRMSFGVYNTEEDIDALITALKKVQRIFNE